MFLQYFQPAPKSKFPKKNEIISNLKAKQHIQNKVLQFWSTSQILTAFSEVQRSLFCQLHRNLKLVFSKLFFFQNLMSSFENQTLWDIRSIQMALRWLNWNFLQLYCHLNKLRMIDSKLSLQRLKLLKVATTLFFVLQTLSSVLEAVSRLSAVDKKMTAFSTKLKNLQNRQIIHVNMK